MVLRIVGGGADVGKLRWNGGGGNGRRGGNLNLDMQESGVGGINAAAVAGFFDHVWPQESALWFADSEPTL